MTLIDEIIANFNWKEVHQYVVKTQWYWDRGYFAHIPTIEEMQQTVRQLYQDIGNESIIERNGFILYHNTHTRAYTLWFAMEQWTVLES